MSVKFRKFLACRRAFALLENRLFDWAWTRSCWRPIKSYCTVKRGKKKGQIRVELYYPENKRIVVLPKHVKYKERVK